MTTYTGAPITLKVVFHWTKQNTDNPAGTNSAEDDYAYTATLGTYSTKTTEWATQVALVNTNKVSAGWTFQEMNCQIIIDEYTATPTLIDVNQPITTTATPMISTLQKANRSSFTIGASDFSVAGDIATIFNTQIANAIAAVSY